MTTTFSTGVVRNGRIELELPLAWPGGTQVLVVPNANDAVAALEQGELARLAAQTPSDEDLRLIAVSPPREWLEEQGFS